MPPLSRRLRRLVDWIPTCERLIDVGTDHAYVPIAALLEGRAQSSVGIDCHQGPIDRACENAGQYSVGDRLSLICANGLTAVSLQEGDVVVLSGIGAKEIADILSQSKRPPGVCFILQPQRDADRLRSFLLAENIALIAEQLVLERGISYVFMMVKDRRDVEHDWLEPYRRYAPAARVDHDLLRNASLFRLENSQTVGAEEPGEQLMTTKQAAAFWLGPALSAAADKWCERHRSANHEQNRITDYEYLLNIEDPVAIDSDFFRKALAGAAFSPDEWRIYLDEQHKKLTKQVRGHPALKACLTGLRAQRFATCSVLRGKNEC